MFKAMSIPRKLGFSFLAINVSAAIMMAVVFVSIMMIRGSTDRNNLSQTIYAHSLTLETAILRQNSQMRGFLVTQDKGYLKSYYEGRDDYDKASTELENLLTDPEGKELVRKSRAETLAWRQKWADRLVDMVKKGQSAEAAQQVRDGGKSVLVSAAVLPLREVRDNETKRIEANSARQETAINTAMIVLVIGGVMLIGIAVALATMLSKMIARPITALTLAMRELAEGRNDVTVPDADRQDELGDMAKAVLVFRDAAVAKTKSDADQAHVVDALGQGLKVLADGDMTYAIEMPFAGEYDQLRKTFNSTVEGLEKSLSQVAHSAQSVRTGSSEILTASEDLAMRTEQQAASIEETAAATTQVTSTVSETARGAAGVRNAIDSVQIDAHDGSDVVQKAVDAMDAIEKGSQEIGKIINVIDGITFQTNLLALNAGVEAARAGEAGKGFAVVANEVRALAQRSADAAKDIKTLITASSEQVSHGVGLVGETGKMLERIAAKIVEVNGLVNEMASATETQALNLSQVDGSVADLDKMTQQNAAMVEQTTACARSLAGEADELASLVARFQLKWQGSKQYSAGRKAA